MKLPLASLILLITVFLSCKKDEQGSSEKPAPPAETLPVTPVDTTTRPVPVKMTVDKTYLTDTTHAINGDYEKFSGVWRVKSSYCSNCSAAVTPLKPDTTEILTLRKNGQYEILKNDTLHYKGTYVIRYDHRCGATALEKTFLFTDAKNIGSAYYFLASTIDLTGNTQLTVAAPKCMVDMEGYKTYERIIK